MDTTRTVLLLFGVIATVMSDPCQQYTEIDDALRKFDYVIPQSSHMVCDRLISDGWYKFATSEMPTSCVRQYRCGTHIPIWLNGTLPSTLGQEKQLKACGDMQQDDSCCGFTSGYVRVRNCGKYFVYFLTAVPGCSIAYCAGDTPFCTGDQYSQTGYKPCSDAYPKLTPTLTSPKIESTDFSFSCNIPYPAGSSDATFEVTWQLDGNPIQGVGTTVLSGLDREARLFGKNLQMDLNKRLTCSVQSRWTDGRAGNRISAAVPSNSYWIGVMFLADKLSLDAATIEETVTLISTIPVVCDTPGDTSCSVNFMVSTDTDEVFTESCKIKLTPGHWNPNTNQGVTLFNVTTSPNIIPTSGSIGHVTLRPVVNGTGTEWNHVPEPVLTVDKKPAPGGAQCRSTGDPHITTFDKKERHYNNYKQGQYTMVRQRKGGSFRVEARTWPCNRVTCNCAVAAREGNDVITIDMCNGKHDSSIPVLAIQNGQMFRNETQIVKDQSGNNYVLKFRSGATVKVNARLVTVRHLDFTVTVPSTFHGDTEGLCGTYDGNPNNDLRRPGGHVDSIAHPNPFIDSWSIPAGSSLFEKAEPLPEAPKQHCQCDEVSGKVSCHPIPPNTDPHKEILNYQCPGCVPVQPHSAVSPTSTPAHVTNLPTTTPPHPSRTVPGVIILTPAPATTMAPTTARKTCEDVLNRFPSARRCIEDEMKREYDDILTMCVTDLQITGDKDMAVGTLNVLMDGCSFNKITNPNITLSGASVAKACPGACSGNGECFRGVCACLDEFEGADCSVQINRPPSLKTIDGGSVCDQEMAACREPVLIGQNIKPEAKCRLEVFQKTSDGPLLIHTEEVPVTYQSVNHASCPILPAYTAYSGIRYFNISITNNGGGTWSNIQQYTIYSSKCVSCDADAHCTTLSTACLINGHCISAGTLSPTSSQWSCDPSVSTDSWTLSKTTAQIPTTTMAPAEGGAVVRDSAYYTAVPTGCSCPSDPSIWDCACCRNYGCPCYEDSPHQCYDCMNDDMCYT